jgi:hypothetical protein
VVGGECPGRRARGAHAGQQPEDEQQQEHLRPAAGLRRRQWRQGLGQVGTAPGCPLSRRPLLLGLDDKLTEMERTGANEADYEATLARLVECIRDARAAYEREHVELRERTAQ